MAFECDDFLRQCYFQNLSCADVKLQIEGANYDFNVELENGQMTIKFENLYVEGKYIDGSAEEERCYL